MLLAWKVTYEGTKASSGDGTVNHADLCAGEEYRATKDLWLSPQSRLLADSPEASDYVYNGQGHRLILPEGLHEGEALPLILIGVGKSLQLKDVKLVHAACLPACIQLGSGKRLSQVTASIACIV